MRISRFHRRTVDACTARHRYNPCLLTVEQVVKNMEQSNRGRSRALHCVEGVRVYRLKYHGPLSDRDAEMAVKVAYQAREKNNLR
jgi:hypothetical protein